MRKLKKNLLKEEQYKRMMMLKNAMFPMSDDDFKEAVENRCI